jgi:hypothetical protein
MEVSIMRFYKNPFYFLLFFTIFSLLIWGCEYESAVEPEALDVNIKQETIVDEPDLNECITIPEGTRILSATLNIFCTHSNNQDVFIYKITQDWSEENVTWNNFGSGYGSGDFGSFNATEGWHSKDITTLVQAWINGDPNYGVLLKLGIESPLANFRSKENSENQPFLRVAFLDDGIPVEIDILPTDDAYISALSPTSNFGTYPLLYTGWVDGKEKQSLIKFCFNVVPGDGGCTNTPGYWKTHSEYGPAPYDATWGKLSNGADTPFFGTGSTYYQMLWMEPKGGNAYIILAHAYIASELNMLSGDSYPVTVNNAFNEATNLLSGYAGYLNIPKKSLDRDAALMYAEILDDYNNGIIGPGHCD